MTKTYLAVGSHWDCPGIRQYSASDRRTAERKCAELVDELIDDFAKDYADEIAASHGVLNAPPKTGVHCSWEETLRALQLARLIQYAGGEGEANDMLFSFAANCSLVDFRGQEPPLIGNGFSEELQRWIAGFVGDDDCDGSDSKIGFPMVWIEEVETLDAPAADNADLETVLAAAQRFADEGEPADNPDQYQRIQEAIERLKAPLQPFPPAFGALDLGAILSVVGWARQFTGDWIEHAEEAEREPAAQACNTVDQVEDAVKALFPLLARTIRIIGDGKGSIDSLLEQVSQMSGMFDDEDGTIEEAADDGCEQSHILGALRADLILAGIQPELPVSPVRIVVDVTGGCVQVAYADGPVDLYVADFDTDGVSGDDEKDLVDIPQADGRLARGSFGGLGVHHNPVLVGAMLAAKHNHVEGGGE